MSQVVVRNISPDLWLQLRIKATERRMTMGALLNEILKEWLARQG